MADTASVVAELGGDARHGPSDLTVSGSQFFFTRTSSRPTGWETADQLWRSDGTAAGTYALLNTPDAPETGEIGHLVPMPDGAVLFTREKYVDDDGIDDTLWRSDGTDAGTFILASDVGYIQADVTLGLAKLLLCVRTDPETFDESVSLYRIDPGTTNARLVARDLAPWASYTMAVLGDQAYFIAPGPDDRSALWRTDGTPNGTGLFFTAPGDSELEDAFAVADGALYFTATDGAAGQLYVSDGTAVGTRPLGSLGVAFCDSETPVRAGDRLYFARHDPTAERGELWFYDLTRRQTGKVTGTTVPRDNDQLLPPSTFVHSLAAVGDKLVAGFTDSRAYRIGSSGFWRTSFFAVDAGHTAATRLANVNGNSVGIVHGGAYYFEDSSRPDGTAYRPLALWRTDGTATGTRKLPDEFDVLDLEASVSFGSGLYFAADESLAEFEYDPNQLWRLHDSGLPAVSVVAVDTAVAEGAAATPAFTVSRTGATTLPLVVSYSIAGSALNGIDYAHLDGSATIPAGASSMTIQLRALADRVLDPDETVTVSLGAAPMYSITPPSATATAKIRDTFVLRVSPQSAERRLLRTRVIRPFRTLILRGSFDPDATTTVIFSGSDGYRAAIEADQVAGDALSVHVPPLTNMVNGAFRAGRVAITVEQRVGAKSVVSPRVLIAVQAPTAFKAPPGAVALALVESYRDELVAVRDRTPATSSDLVARREAMTAIIEVMNRRVASISEVLSGRTVRMATFGTQAVNLTPANVGQLDVWLYEELAALFADRRGSSDGVRSLQTTIELPLNSTANAVLQSLATGGNPAGLKSQIRGLVSTAFDDQRNDGAATQSQARQRAELTADAVWSAGKCAAVLAGNAAASGAMGAGEVAVGSAMWLHGTGMAGVAFWGQNAFPNNPTFWDEQMNEATRLKFKGAELAAAGLVDLAIAKHGTPDAQLLDDIKDCSDAKALLFGTPRLTLSRVQGEALEGSQSILGRVRITNTGAPFDAWDATVYLVVSGSAVRGDYEIISPSGDVLPLRKGDLVNAPGAGFDPDTIAFNWPGEAITSVDLFIRARPDGDTEGDETVSVRLATRLQFTVGSNYAIGAGGAADITIRDSTPPVVSVEAIDDKAVEGSDDTAEFVFTRTAGQNLDEDLIVRYSLEASTAQNYQDYTDGSGAALSGTITIPAGETSATITIRAKRDTLAEGPRENVFIFLVDSAAYNLEAGTNGAVVYIYEEPIAGTYRGRLVINTNGLHNTFRLNANVEIGLNWGTNFPAGGYVGALTSTIAGSVWDDVRQRWIPASSRSEVQYFQLKQPDRYERGGEFFAELIIQFDTSIGVRFFSVYAVGTIGRDGRITATLAFWTNWGEGEAVGSLTLTKV